MYKTISVLIVLLLCIQVSPGSPLTDAGTAEKTSEPLGMLQNISSADDGFHGTTTSFHIESWYFDAVFDQNYSMAFVVTVLQRGQIGLVLTGLYLYQETNLVAHPRHIYSFQQSIVSSEQPCITVGNSTIINGTLNASRWRYHVSLELDGQGVDLWFENVTSGWMTDIRGGWWLVVPDLTVNGTITVNDLTMQVSGEGYHDHNWFYPYGPLIQKGWEFFNAQGENLGVTMAEVMKNRLVGEPVTILNQKGAPPVLIPPDTVQFKVTRYMVDHWRLIPRTCTLVISSSMMQANLTMEARNFNYVKLPLLNYWRYHVHITGTITRGTLTEQIDQVRISELLRFF